MSRRPNPAADRAAQNQQTIKNLLKLDCNKTCADCKRNKHPRWASWNLGVFVCIRCSGIHRGMGTHISRVKSVDLDSWTDEQLQSVLKWGNARANKYWEHKLVPGHVPSEAYVHVQGAYITDYKADPRFRKIENFIRTKYETKRWVMEGPMPDPATLDPEGDDNVPLAVVQEKAKLEQPSVSQRATSASTQPPPRPQTQTLNLFDDDPPVPPVRPNTTDLSGPRTQAKPGQPSQSAAPPKQTKPADSLLGLDFFGPPQSAPINRPSSAVSNPSSTGPSRPDLKQSILSLYASAPKTQAPAQHERNPSFGSLSAMQAPPQARQQNDAFGGLTDAFSGLTFPSTVTPSAPKQSSVSAFDSLGSSMSPPAASKPFSPSPAVSGGGFFDSIPSKPEPKTQQSRTQSIPSGNNFDLIGSTMGSTKSTAAPPSTSNTTLDFFSSPPPASPPTAAYQPSNVNSVFNLSSTSQKPATTSPPAATSNVANLLGGNTLDPWGDSAWGAPEPAAPPKEPASAMKVPEKLTANDLGGGWGSSAAVSKPTPTVSADEDFGGWTSPTQNNTGKPKPAGGFGGNDDLFSNVWE